VTAPDILRESRLRRLARQQGYRLQKARTRVTAAPEYGTYHLVETWNNTIAVSGLASGYGLSLDDVERALRDVPDV